MENIEPHGSIVNLLGEIFDDTQLLIKQELALAKSEVRDEITKLIKSVAFYAIALSLGLTTAILLGFSFSYFLTEIWPEINTGLGFFISSIIFSILTVLFIIKGINTGRQFKIIPEKSIASMQRDIKLVKESV